MAAIGACAPLDAQRSINGVLVHTLCQMSSHEHETIIDVLGLSRLKVGRKFRT